MFPISNFRTSDYLAMLNEVVLELVNSTPGQLHSDKLPNLRNLTFITPYPEQSDPAAQETPPGI